jgi:Skp family chaperone for outer membrane proteins
VKHSIPAVLALGLLALSAFPAAAQPARPSAAAPQALPGTSIALVDLNTVFQNHLRFKAAMDDLRNDIRTYESTLSQRQRQAAQISEQLGAFKTGTAEYKQLEGQLAQASADLQVDVALKRKEFLEREAKVYFHAYMEVVEQVAEHAQRNGIVLVLSYNGEPIDPQDRGSVLQGVNRAVVFQRMLDITPHILDRLNRGAAPQSVGTRPAIPQRR